MGRVSIFLILAALIAGTVCLSVLASSGSNTAEGAVDHKAVTGVKDNTSYTILMNAAIHGKPWIVLKDGDYEGYFSEDGNAVVSEALESKMKEEYSVINYLVNVETAPEDGLTRPYRASRETFNSMEVGTKVKFRWSGPAELPEIVELLPGSD